MEDENTVEVIKSLAFGVGSAIAAYTLKSIPKLKTSGKAQAGEAQDMDGIAGEINLKAVFGGRDKIIVRAEGESMVGVGIQSGEYVVFNKEIEPKYGDIALVAIQDPPRRVIKILRAGKKEHMVALESAYLDREYSEDISTKHVELLGKYVGRFSC